MGRLLRKEVGYILAYTGPEKSGSLPLCERRQAASSPQLKQGVSADEYDELLFEGTSRFYGDGELVYSETGDLLVLLTLQEVKKLGNLCDKENRVVLPDWLLKKFIKENMYSFYHTLLMGEVEADGKSCREMDLMGIELVYKRCHRKKERRGCKCFPQLK